MTPTLTATAPSSLVAELRAGTPQAFDALNSTYRPMIVAVARRCGLSYDDAEDVAQETLTAAYRSIGAIADPAALPGWLRTTATRHAWRISGTKRSTPQRLDHLASVAACGAGEESDERLIRDEARQLVAAAVRCLSPRDQLVLALTVTAEPPISYVEISKRLGCAVGSIGTFRRRALDRLERVLASGRVARCAPANGS